MTENTLQDDLVALAYQYLNDMRHPVTNAGSIKRRIEAIEKVLKNAKRQAGLTSFAIDELRKNEKF